MPTAFALLSIVSVFKNIWGGGINAARGLISQDIAGISDFTVYKHQIKLYVICLSEE